VKFVDEFRDAKLGQVLAGEILAEVDPHRHYKVMEVCGGHTHSIYKYGIDDLLPDIPCRILSAGNPNLYVAVRDPQTVDRAQVDTTRMRALQTGGQPICLYVFAPTKEGAYSRMFAPEVGVVEDPATGSSVAPMVATHRENNVLGAQNELRVEQGTKMGRRGILRVRLGPPLQVGGEAVAVFESSLSL